MAIVRFVIGFLEGLVRFTPALAALAFAGAYAGGPVDERTVLDVRFGPAAEKTRIVLDILGPFDHRVRYSAEGEPLLVVELPVSRFEIDGRAELSGAGLGRGHVAAFDFGPSPEAGSQLFFALAKPAVVADVFTLPPKDGLAHGRLVIDLVSAGPDAMAAADGAVWGGYEPEAQAARPASVGPGQVVASPSLKPRAARPETAAVAPAPLARPVAKRVVVVDAGHGGKDPGALGKKSTREKDVTLKAALALQAFLEATGRYDVVLTRDDDTFLPLDKRAEIARAAQADLFISLHADAIASSRVRGASVWTLSEDASARMAKKIVSSGDFMFLDDELADAEVGGILLDLAQRETKNQSARFAQLLIPELAKVTPLVNNTHRTAGYRVLLSPDTPAVLLELAFISNASDEANLIDAEWREAAMRAVADAIDAYFDQRPLVRHASIR